MAAMVRAVLATCRDLGVAAAVVVLAGCAGPPPPAPPRAAEIGPPKPIPESRIRPTDKLAVRVLFEPDLSSPEVRVDAAGLVSLPVAGDLKVAGLTTREVADIVADRLRTYVRQPQVTVSVLSTAGDHVVVEGSVNEPGVFDIGGTAGLLEVLARAKGPNRTAALSQVTIFRRIDGRRAGAVFNVNRIRRGIDEEPQLYPGDTVVVGFSFLKGAYRDFLTVAPAAVSIFRLY